MVTRRQQISCGVRKITASISFPSWRRIVNDFSQADLDDGPLLDFFEPGLQARFVLLPEQDLADLRLGPDQPLPLEALLCLELEAMVAERRPVRVGYPARLKA